MFEIINEGEVDIQSVMRALRRKSYELFGTFYAPVFQLIEFDPKTKIGIIRCAREDVEKLRVVFAFLRKIDSDKPIVINDIYCSGTLKKLREKTSNIKQFELDV